jgi:mRNA interferase MazF
MYFKDFDQWNRVKKHTDSEPEQGGIVRAGEIRWAILGVNVGSEIDGKGHAFTRPVLILHVVGKNLALIVPLSTKLKETAGYESFVWRSREVSLCVHQMKVISQKRLLRRQGKISSKRLNDVRAKILKFFSLA